MQPKELGSSSSSNHCRILGESFGSLSVVILPPHGHTRKSFSQCILCGVCVFTTPNIQGSAPFFLSRTCRQTEDMSRSGEPFRLLLCTICLRLMCYSCVSHAELQLVYWGALLPLPHPCKCVLRSAGLRKKEQGIILAHLLRANIQSNIWRSWQKQHKLPSSV